MTAAAVSQWLEYLNKCNAVALQLELTRRVTINLNIRIAVMFRIHYYHILTPSSEGRAEINSTNWGEYIFLGIKC